MNDLLRRVLVIGASGQLGSDLLETFAGLDAVDIERPAEVAAALAHHRPSLVVNTAAYHNVERCETHAERAFAVNAVAVDALASMCDAADVALAHVSTDYVFDGHARAPYPEDAAANPLNVYGVSKFAGEQAVRARTERHFIFRTSGLYGVRGSSTKGYTFAERMRERARAGKPLRVVDDVECTPSFTRDVARTMRAVIERGTFGTFHVTNAGSCTWYDFACEVLAASGLEASVERTTSDAYPSFARRPAYSVLAHDALERAGIASPPDWKAGLHAYLAARDT